VDSLALDLVLKHCRMLARAQVTNVSGEIINHTQAVPRFLNNFNKNADLCILYGCREYFLSVRKG